jgi:hypothetical protein
LAQQGLVDPKTLLPHAEEQGLKMPLPHIKSDNEYVDELERKVPADKLLELGVEHTRQVVELLRERDQIAAIAQEQWRQYEAQVTVMRPEFERLRNLARDLAERVTRTHNEEKGNHLVGDFSQDMLFFILECGEELLLSQYASQLQEKAPPEDEVVPPETFSLAETGNINVFQAKAALIASQEATRQGLTYLGCSVAHNAEFVGFDVHLRFNAKPGQQLDRVQLKRLLDRHKPVGMDIRMTADVQVKVPL